MSSTIRLGAKRRGVRNVGPTWIGKPAITATQIFLATATMIVEKTPAAAATHCPTWSAMSVTAKVVGMSAQAVTGRLPRES